VQSWIDTPQYDVRGDLDLDGVVDAADKSNLDANFLGSDLGIGLLTLPSSSNRIGFAGGQWEDSPGLLIRRRRLLSPARGDWLRRDPAGYQEGNNLYQYSASAPIGRTDPSGLSSWTPTWPPEGVQKGAGSKTWHSSSLGCMWHVNISTLPSTGKECGSHIDWWAGNSTASDGACETKSSCRVTIPQLVLNIEPDDPNEPQDKGKPFYDKWHEPESPGITWSSTNPTDFPTPNVPGNGGTSMYYYQKPLVIDADCGGLSSMKSATITATSSNKQCKVAFRVKVFCLDACGGGSGSGSGGTAVGGYGSTSAPSTPGTPNGNGIGPTDPTEPDSGGGCGPGVGAAGGPKRPITTGGGVYKSGQ
jgi:RHS repeat-associated protein